MKIEGTSKIGDDPFQIPNMKVRERFLKGQILRCQRYIDKMHLKFGARANIAPIETEMIRLNDELFKLLAKRDAGLHAERSGPEPPPAAGDEVGTEP